MHAFIANINNGECFNMEKKEEKKECDHEWEYIIVDEYEGCKCKRCPDWHLTLRMEYR